MPISIIKESAKYCGKNKLFFTFILIFLFICQYITNLVDSVVIGPIIMSIISTGYGLQVTEDIISGGGRLPKINLRKIISYGLKGEIVGVFYLLIQMILLTVITDNLNFPILEVEDFLLNFNEVLHLLFTHDPISFALFVIATFVTTYITAFFMELALARLSDGGKLKNAFNFLKIKRAIDIIGWKNYAIDYTKIVLSIVILTFILHYEIPITIVNSVVDSILRFLMFAIEFIGIGQVYKIYKDNKV